MNHLNYGKCITSTRLYHGFKRTYKIRLCPKHFQLRETQVQLYYIHLNIEHSEILSFNIIQAHRYSSEAIIFPN